MAVERSRKRNFTETEIEVLVSEVEQRKNILFGGHSCGITNKRKALEWQSVVAEVNAVSVTERSVADIKKKWSDMKVEAKRKVACHRQSVPATGGGPGTSISTPLLARISAMLGLEGVCSIVVGKEEDTDQAEETVTQLEAVSEEKIPGWTSPENPAAEKVFPTTSVPREPGAPGSGRVLIDTVMQMQRDTISAVTEVRDELRQICGVLAEISSSLKELVNKNNQ